MTHTHAMPSVLSATACGALSAVPHAAPAAALWAAPGAVLGAAGSAPRRRRASRVVAAAVAISLLGMGIVQEARAALIGTETVARAAAPVADATLTGDQARAQVLSVLARDEAVSALSERGVDAAQARERVAALSDAEAIDLARRIGKAPAGAGVLDTVVFIFVLLLITDILGFTKVFPFTRSIR